MLRVMDGKIRAFLSNRYLRLDHHEVACAVIPEIGTIPDVQFVSNQITENHLYMKAIIPVSYTHLYWRIRFSKRANLIMYAALDKSVH